MTPPILFLHGSFSHGGLFSPWIEYFGEYGYECHAPSLPGRLPSDRECLRNLTMARSLEAVLEVRNAMADPPIVMGHSMGGLLAQQVAAASPCAALVLLASAPPGVLWAQPVALPHLVKLLPTILLGRPFRPAVKTLDAVVFNDLASDEKEILAKELVLDSGQVFRSMILGLIRVPRGAVECPVMCVSGGVDRNVSSRTSRAIATRYGARHEVMRKRGHWIIAESAVNEVAPVVLQWLSEIGLGTESVTGITANSSRTLK